MDKFNKIFIHNLRRNISILILFFILLIIISISKPTNKFPQKPFDISIPRNTSISSIAEELYSKNIISSKFLFKLSSMILSQNKGVFAGDYRFTKPQSTIAIAYRMVRGNQDQPRLSITIPEGTNVFDMATIYQNKLSNFNASRFVALAQRYEGYLFPDTYFFFANTSAEEIIRTMRANFDEKIKPLENDIKKFNKPLRDIIIMASIVEKEARGQEDRKIVSGILWKRLNEGMPLQVDPPFYYITAKTNKVTYDDLKIDSPYNTYKYKGLPKGPISNPGIESIKDTINPTLTKYYFYLTGNDGAMRYATVYDNHLSNKNTYLK